MNIKEKFDHLVSLLSNPKFLNCEILLNDIPLFIADYDIAEENDFLKMQENLVKQLESKDIPVLNINLYDLMIELLQSNQGDWNWVIDEKRNKKELFEELKAILNVQNRIIPAIYQKMKENKGNYKLVFINGCGNIFPSLRTHTILNNLHIHINKTPIIVFFPGIGVSKGSPYSSFNLFGRLNEGNDYRAANIFQIHGA